MLLVNASPGTRLQGRHISTLVHVIHMQSLQSLSQIMHSNATSTQRTYISARNLPPTLPTPNTRIPVHYYPSPSPNTSSNLPPLTPNPHIEQRTATTLNRPQAQHAPPINSPHHPNITSHKGHKRRYPFTICSSTYLAISPVHVTHPPIITTITALIPQR